MITNKNAGERLSALVDGEVDDASLDAALASLRNAKGDEDWEIYHRIGEVLRSEELAAPLSAGFAARMAERLEAETPHVAATNQSVMPAPQQSVMSGGLLAVLRRYLVPGMAGTAALAIAVMLVPQWMPGSQQPAGEMANATQAPAAEPATTRVVPTSTVDHKDKAATFIAEPQTLVSESDIVRDPRLDQYLMAHQRFSPAAYGSSQFVRSATFAAEVDK